ncbi:MAG TPA: hypothetical protein VFQ23_25350 [Anaerolineales bacterium]|nr:hypothetical protein [Anaerolineales bacterium]
MKYGNFHGHKSVILENVHFQVECLAQAGPRVVRLIPAWTGENLFAEVPDFTTKTTLGEYQYFGGHRLWYAPESLSRTYSPDSHGISIKEVQDGLRLTGMDEPGTGIQKTLTIQISPTRSFIILQHKLQNNGRATVRLAPWAITMLRPTGVAILPQQHGNLDDDGVMPNRRFALWPYSRWDDVRLQLGDEFVIIKGDNTNSSPLKLGYFNPHGWLGYLCNDVFFVKRFGVRRDKEYADYGSNSEIYTNDRITELESLGPILDLNPHEDVVHTETWEVYRDTDIPQDLFGGKTLQDVLSKNRNLNHGTGS